jgi:hypothetical protein
MQHEAVVVEKSKIPHTFNQTVMRIVHVIACHHTTPSFWPGPHDIYCLSAPIAGSVNMMLVGASGAVLECKL